MFFFFMCLSSIGLCIMFSVKIIKTVLGDLLKKDKLYQYAIMHEVEAKKYLF